MKRKYCSICKKKLPRSHPGRNNPWPVVENGECCNDCNWRFVIQARIKLMHRSSWGRKSRDRYKNIKK